MWPIKRLVYNAVRWYLVTRQLVLDVAAHGVPDIHKAIARAARDLLAIGRPRTAQEVLLKVVLVALEHLGAPTAHDEGAQVPDAQRVVHAVAQQERAVVADAQARDRVRVLGEALCNLALAQIP